MLGPRGVTFLLGGVVLVVAGQVELAEVQDRVPAVQFELGVGDLFCSSAADRCASSCPSASRSPSALAVASRARPARTPAGDRSCGLPSYSCRPAYSRTSATSRSQTARTRGERSMRQTLPEVLASGEAPGNPQGQAWFPEPRPGPGLRATRSGFRPPRRGLMRRSGRARHSRIHDQARTGRHVRHGGLNALARLSGWAGRARTRR